MKFGVFDHLDRNDLALGDFYRKRLELAERYDRAGFHGYHIAEHHATPLGMSPSPSVYLSALAQHTKKLRFGPMVYCLPLYHPLRLIEEICMIDQLSDGRFELGIGRGVSPFEAKVYGLDYTYSKETYAEFTDVMLKGLTSKELDHKGARFTFDKVPMHVEPAQKPHPPLWFGVLKAENAELAAHHNGNFVTLLNADNTRKMIDIYRSKASRPEGALVGQSLFIVVADSEEKAHEIGNRCYARWRDSFHYLYYRNKTSPVFGERAQTFTELQREGLAIGGTPEQVRNFLRDNNERAGINYFVGQFAFGAMTQDETISSIDLFVQEVMPALQKEKVAA
jgi:alkanesulfonate monooxygenase SsuD/methylene tetrahydromethanopterin reductase-like flavin-dependent oxidoreductase (luciferase family)